MVGRHERRVFALDGESLVVHRQPVRVRANVIEILQELIEQCGVIGGESEVERKKVDVRVMGRLQRTRSDQLLAESEEQPEQRERE